ncbi:HAMP domain-containing sensor histidine kinase [Enterocloster citroniae]|uniref:sensor histidine kinase n=1 Tax=Enterocloster citroniae TaxID=358743 RepID=UPI0032C0CBA0
MSRRKNILITIGFVLSISLISSALAVMMISQYDNRLQFNLLNAVCGEVLEQAPETERIISAALKEYTDGNADGIARDNVLSALGYRVSDFSNLTYKKNILFVIVGVLTGFLLLIITLLYRNQKEGMRIRVLAEYLEQANTGKAVILSTTGEDDFSKLEDEIYKTVTYLYQTREAAVQIKNKFAENLSNIAHQIKTPITAISLSVQIMQKEGDKNQLAQIQKQLLRLSHLEEALLVISRLDAGTLVFQKKEVDVFTVLVLAADNLQELLIETGTSIDIPELGEMAITADLDWTMEAVMNLMKNCMEHNPGGVIHCAYEQNPLYTDIVIWDEGKGFLKEDMPHLFERFYRGHNAHEGGIGIGLALAKEIVECQNGTIRTSNRQGAGACFEIRFYSH